MWTAYTTRITHYEDLEKQSLEEKEKKIKFPEVKIKKRKEPKEAGEQKKSGDQKERQ